ncbi:MAG: hypothetical protein U9P79_10490 [Candidatus Cloacimonadota bacterium]|nr:hypothetical protein [Candidatus Cloacimonadota bacterium]
MMKRLLITLLCLTFFFSPLLADNSKSRLKAALLSAAIPGMGELYASGKTSGMISLTSEALLWLGYYANKQQAEWAKNNFQQYARAYSNSSYANPDEDYYDLIQNYQSSNVYNNNVLIYARQGLYSGWSEQTYNQFVSSYLQTGSRSWNWESEENFIEYARLRVDRNEYNIMAKFTIGAMVLNRIVSMIKAVHSVNVHNSDVIKTNTVSFLYDINPIRMHASFYLQKRF